MDGRFPPAAIILLIVLVTGCAPPRTLPDTAVEPGEPPKIAVEHTFAVPGLAYTFDADKPLIAGPSRKAILTLSNVTDDYFVIKRVSPEGPYDTDAIFSREEIGSLRYKEDPDDIFVYDSASADLTRREINTLLIPPGKSTGIPLTLKFINSGSVSRTISLSYSRIKQKEIRYACYFEKVAGSGASIFTRRQFRGAINSGERFILNEFMTTPEQALFETEFEVAKNPYPRDRAIELCGAAVSSPCYYCDRLNAWVFADDTGSRVAVGEHCVAFYNVKIDVFRILDSGHKKIRMMFDDLAAFRLRSDFEPFIEVTGNTAFVASPHAVRLIAIAAKTGFAVNAQPALDDNTLYVHEP